MTSITYTKLILVFNEAQIHCSSKIHKVVDDYIHIRLKFGRWISLNCEVNWTVGSESVY